VKPWVLGCDPGLEGALALFNSETCKIEMLHDMPVTQGRVDPAKLAAVIDAAKFMAGGALHGAVELTGSLPRQRGAYNFGLSNGVLHGCLGALGVPFTLVQPAQWKSSMGLRKMIDETQAGTKTRAREIASKLWPERAEDFKRAMDADRAEAALIARFFASKNGWLATEAVAKAKQIAEVLS